MFYLTMRTWLLDYGFVASDCDECLFIFHPDKFETILVGIHVDDLLVVASSTSVLDPFQAALASRWNTTAHTGNDHNYVGLHFTIDRANDSAAVDMRGSIIKILAEFGHGLTPASTPADASILLQSGEPLTPEQRLLFMSLIMTLLYCARLAYSSILFPVVLLATRMASPTTDDMQHGYRIVRYLMTQLETKLIYRAPPGDVRLTVYVDASHGIHSDGRGHYCLIATLGGAPIAVKSAKVEFVTTSSTETELTAVSSTITYVLWLRRVLAQLGFPQAGPTVIYQDNLSAIAILNQGHGTFKRTKHIFLRFAFIKEHLNNNDIAFAHCPTAEMWADIGTKIHGPSALANMLKQMHYV